MTRQTLPAKTHSWLSLVAETAGVSHAVIARVRIQHSGAAEGFVRAIVQVKDTRGRVVGATRWEGDGEQLRRGAPLDLGCDLSVTQDASIVAWLDGLHTRIKPAAVVAPADATVQSFDPARSVTLVLTPPTSEEAA